MGKKKRNRQAGSLKLWVNEKTNTYWQSVKVHNGRVTTEIRGPEGVDEEAAHELLNAALRKK